MSSISPIVASALAKNVDAMTYRRWIQKSDAARKFLFEHARYPFTFICRSREELQAFRDFISSVGMKYIPPIAVNTQCESPLTMKDFPIGITSLHLSFNSDIILPASVTKLLLNVPLKMWEILPLTKLPTGLTELTLYLPSFETRTVVDLSFLYSYKFLEKLTVSGKNMIIRNIPESVNQLNLYGIVEINSLPSTVTNLGLSLREEINVNDLLKDCRAKRLNVGVSNRGKIIPFTVPSSVKHLIVDTNERVIFGSGCSVETLKCRRNFVPMERTVYPSTLKHVGIRVNTLSTKTTFPETLQSLMIYDAMKKMSFEEVVDNFSFFENPSKFDIFINRKGRFYKCRRVPSENPLIIQAMGGETLSVDRAMWEKYCSMTELPLSFPALEILWKLVEREETISPFVPKSWDPIKVSESIYQELIDFSVESKFFRKILVDQFNEKTRTLNKFFDSLSSDNFNVQEITEFKRFFPDRSRLILSEEGEGEEKESLKNLSK